jgi:hypothetical protein
VRLRAAKGCAGQGRHIFQKNEISDPTHAPTPPP